MSASKPVIFVTRRLPAAVEERLQRDYAPQAQPRRSGLWPGRADRRLRRRGRDPDLRDRSLASRADRAPAGRRAGARDLLRRLRAHRSRGGERPRHHGDQHPRRADRGHRRPHAAVPARRGAARLRGRGAGAHRPLERLDPDPAARPRARRQRARHRRHGPDRPRGRAPRAGVRHAASTITAGTGCRPSSSRARTSITRCRACWRRPACSACTARRGPRPSG